AVLVVVALDGAGGFADQSVWFVIRHQVVGRLANGGGVLALGQRAALHQEGGTGQAGQRQWRLAGLVSLPVAVALLRLDEPVQPLADRLALRRFDLRPRWDRAAVRRLQRRRVP